MMLHTCCPLPPFAANDTGSSMVRIVNAGGDPAEAPQPALPAQFAFAWTPAPLLVTPFQPLAAAAAAPVAAAGPPTMLSGAVLPPPPAAPGQAGQGPPPLSFNGEPCEQLSPSDSGSGVPVAAGQGNVSVIQLCCGGTPSATTPPPPGPAFPPLPAKSIAAAGPGVLPTPAEQQQGLGAAPEGECRRLPCWHLTCISWHRHCRCSRWTPASDTAAAGYSTLSTTCRAAAAAAARSNSSPRRCSLYACRGGS
jgi:hypothetical protein